MKVYTSEIYSKVTFLRKDIYLGWLGNPRQNNGCFQYKDRQIIASYKFYEI